LPDSVNIHGFVVGGQGQALLVFLALDFSVGKKPNVLDRALVFYTDAQLVYIRNKHAYIMLIWSDMRMFVAQYYSPSWSRGLGIFCLVC